MVDTQANNLHSIEFITGEQLQIPTVTLLDESGKQYPKAKIPEIDRQRALDIYDTMVFIRILDERMVAAQRQGRLSFYLTCTGEEAAVTGSAAALNKNDMIMGQYREQAALRYRGFTTDQFMEQMMGTHKDLGKGRQMPVHYGSNELNYMTISSPLATQIPQAAGYAYGQKLAGEEACTLCYFGEGAASEGDFHAGLNMASVLHAPVIFFCRNNGYAISTPTDEQYAGDGIAPRGVGYGIDTIRVDGNDFLAVYLATLAARKKVIHTNKPVLIEAMTYRLGAHSTSDDPSGYRSKDEENQWRSTGPILRMKAWLMERAWWTEAEDDQLIKTYRSEVLDAMKKAEAMESPPLDAMITDVYDVTPQHLQDQFTELKAHLDKYPDAYPASKRRGGN